MLLLNAQTDRGYLLPSAQASELDAAAAAEVMRYLTHTSDYQPTPIHDLSALADQSRGRRWGERRRWARGACEDCL
jgi:hypothetical protein